MTIVDAYAGISECRVGRFSSSHKKSANKAHLRFWTALCDTPDNAVVDALADAGRTLGKMTLAEAIVGLMCLLEQWVITTLRLNNLRDQEKGNWVKFAEREGLMLAVRNLGTRSGANPTSRTALSF